MNLDRRRVSALLACAALAPVAAGSRPAVATATPRVTVTDMVGRVVDLPRRVERIVLLDARDCLSMAVLHPNPAGLIVGWAGAGAFDSDLVRRQYDGRADGGTIPVVGGLTADTVSIENILALMPDLVVATAHMEPALEDGVVTRRLEAAGIPVIFSNAASNRETADGPDRDPILDIAPVMRMWGTILDREPQARAFTDFVQERLAFVQERLRGLTPCKTYLELQSTYDDCCWAAGTRIWGDLLALAGGENLSAVDAPWYAKVAPEQLIAEAPEVYIASGGAYASARRPSIGPGLRPERGREGLRRLCERRGFETLPAVRNGRVHGIWTGLVTVQPLNILFVEVAGKWLHPDAFQDVEPATTLAEINRRFLSEPLGDPCWLSLLQGKNDG